MTKDDAGTSASRRTAPSTRTDGETVTRWLNNTYILYDLEDGAEAKVLVREFLNIVHTDCPECYVPEDTLVLSLALSVKKWNRSNTVIISDPHAQRLYHLGIGTDTRAEVFESCPTLQQALLNPEKRWIIIPCNDGVLNSVDIGKGFHKNGQVGDEPAGPSQGTSRSRSATDKESESNESQESSSQEEGQSGDQEKEHEKNNHQSNGPVQHGTHWGLLVIDKTEKVARWIDSAIALERRSDKPSKLKFGPMHSAAIAAGKVLCGIDTLLGEENGFSKGGFTTSTLKYVPQQGTDNSYSGHDGGPCGPFMFAFLEHISEQATTLDRVGLRKMFPRSERGQLQFNSMHARQEMRRLIQHESEQPDEIPFQLSLDLLRILNVLPVEHLQSSVDAYRDKAATPNRPSTKQPSKLPRGFEFDPQFLAAFKQDKLDNPKVYEDLEDDAKALELFYTMQQSGLIAHGKATGKEGANGSGTDSQNSNKTTKGPTRDVYLGRQLYRNIPLDDATIWPPHDQDFIYWPRCVKELPDFTKVDKKGLIGWLRKNMEIREHKEKGKNHSSATSCAMLHRKFKKTFLGESDDNFKAVWSKDETVFDTQDPNFIAINALQDDKLKYGEMRLLMMEHYEADTLTNLLANLAKYKPNMPASGSNNNDKGDDDDDDDDEPKDDGNDNPGQSTSGSDPDRSSAGQNGDGNDGVFSNQDPNGSGPGGNEADPNIPTDGNPSNNPSGWDRPTAKPLGLLDFRAMPEPDLVEYQMPDKLADPRLRERNVNTVSWRAFLFVTIQGERFAEESDHNCINLWLKDTVVFNDEDRRVDWIGLTGVIRSRMEAHYCLDTSPSPTPRLGQIDAIDELTEEDTDIFLGSVPSESSDDSEDGSGDSRASPTKRKRDDEDSSPEDASSNKRTKHDTTGSGVPTNVPTDSSAEPPEQTSNNRNGPNDIEFTKGKQSARAAQRQQALRAVGALQDAAKTIQDSADGLKGLSFPASPVSTTLTTGNDDDGDKFSEAYREDRLTHFGARPSSAAGGDDDGSESESSSESSGLSDPPDSDSGSDSDDSSDDSSDESSDDSSDESSDDSSDESSDDSSDSSKPSESEESFESEDLDSGDETDVAKGSKKRRRDSEDDNTRDKTGASKKPKTSHLPSSGESGAVTDPNSSNIDDPPPIHSDDSDDTVIDEPAPDPQISSSFESQATLEDPTTEIYIGWELYTLNPEDTSLFLPWDDTKQHWPNNVTELPDFAHMDALEFVLWYKASPELKAKVGVQNNKANLVTYRAELHIKFKKTFLHEQDKNFTDVWLNDTTVFGAVTTKQLQAIKDPRLRNGETRLRMMTTYEPAMLQRLADLPKSIPKLTVQAGSFEDPESFESDTVFVEVSRKPALPTDPSLLLPKATAMTERSVRSKYGLRRRPKPSKKKREG